MLSFTVSVNSIRIRVRIVVIDKTKNPLTMMAIAIKTNANSYPSNCQGRKKNADAFKTNTLSPINTSLAPLKLC